MGGSEMAHPAAVRSWITPFSRAHLNFGVFDFPGICYFRLHFIIVRIVFRMELEVYET